MPKTELLQWQQNLINRLERDLGRALVAADLPCITWNQSGQTLIVDQPPLRAELKSRNLISNVYRSANFIMGRRQN